jgi:hypothetical protein
MIKILITIPHYFGPSATENQGLSSYNPREKETRTAALQACLDGLASFACPAYRLDAGSRGVWGEKIETSPPSHEIEILVVCAQPDRALLSQVQLPPQARQVDLSCAPEFLGFACWEQLVQHIGSFDWFGYLEDDIVIQDPNFFRKLRWFNTTFGGTRVLQPNRYEQFYRWINVYIDGEPERFSRWRYAPRPPLRADYGGESFDFVHPINPMSGCFFLHAAQMDRLAKSTAVLDRDCASFHPMEAAQFLHLRGLFDLYKPAPKNADFLQVRHAAPRLSDSRIAYSELLKATGLQLGSISTRGIDAIFTCKGCGYNITKPVGQLIMRYGVNSSVFDVSETQDCPNCGERKLGFHISLSFLAPRLQKAD